MSFKMKMMSIVILACAACTFAAVAVSMRQNKAQLEVGIVSKARTVLSRLESSRTYVATQGGLKFAIDQITSKHTSPEQLSAEEKMVVLKQVPIFAAMKIGADQAEKENYQFRVFSDEPRRSENKATSEELEVFKRFESDPQLEEYVKSEGGKITVFRPVRLSEEQGCLFCHGHPSTSPWKNGKDVLGYPMENWKDGKLHGVFAVISDVDAVVKAQAKDGSSASTGSLLLWTALSSLISIALAAYLIRQPVQRLQRIVSGLIKQSESLSGVSTGVLQNSEMLSSAATQTAASVQETTAAVEEITATMSKNSERAIETREVAVTSASAAGRGKESVSLVVASINEIDTSNDRVMKQIQDSNAELSEIVKMITEIGDRTRVINDIVFQTKLLSFNASVEAARAGEHGKGFAVVAEEVGNLATMSGNASKEISSLLEDSVRRVQQIVEATRVRVEQLSHESRATVENGGKTAEGCGSVLEEIVSLSERVRSNIETISHANQEQAVGLTEISKSIHQIDEATQSNHQIAIKTSEISQELSRESQQLYASVQELVEIVDGKRAGKVGDAAA